MLHLYFLAGSASHHNYNATKAKKKNHNQVALLKNIYPQYLSIAAEEERKENIGIVIDPSSQGSLKLYSHTPF